MQKNIDFRIYEGGHMMYIHEPSMKQLRKDVEAFYESALKHEDTSEIGRGSFESDTVRVGSTKRLRDR